MPEFLYGIGSCPTNMLQRFVLASSNISKILACLCQTQRTIRAAANLVGIVAVLAVI